MRWCMMGILVLWVHACESRVTNLMRVLETNCDIRDLCLHGPLAAGELGRVWSRPGHGATIGAAAEMRSWDDEVRCTLLTTCRAHQRAINLLGCEMSRVVTASQDHTLKVREVNTWCA